jgi:hypothetical protein
VFELEQFVDEAGPGPLVFAIQDEKIRQTGIHAREFTAFGARLGVTMSLLLDDGFLADTFVLLVGGTGARVLEACNLGCV